MTRLFVTADPRWTDPTLPRRGRIKRRLSADHQEGLSTRVPHRCCPPRFDAHFRQGPARQADTSSAGGRGAKSHALGPLVRARR